MLGPPGSHAFLRLCSAGGGSERHVSLRRLAAGPAYGSLEGTGGVRPEGSLDSVASLEGTPRGSLRGLGLTFHVPESAAAAPGLGSGAVIKRVKEGGAASRVGGPGVRPGDILLSVDGVEVAGADSARLARLVMGAPGSAAELRLRRHAEDFAVRVVRDAAAPGALPPPGAPPCGSLSSPLSGAGLGMVFLSQRESGAAGGGGGLVVKRVTPGGPADLAGVQPGHRLLQVDGKEVQSLEGELGRCIRRRA